MKVSFFVQERGKDETLTKGELLVPEHLCSLDEHNLEHCPPHRFFGCAQHSGKQHCSLFKMPSR